jgi:hypothetical protein
MTCPHPHDCDDSGRCVLGWPDRAQCTGRVVPAGKSPSPDRREGAGDGVARTPAETCRLAAELLDLEAAGLFDAHTLHGEWMIENEQDQAAKDDHDTFGALAEELRELAERMDRVQFTG